LPPVKETAQTICQLNLTIASWRSAQSDSQDQADEFAYAFPTDGASLHWLDWPEKGNPTGFGRDYRDLILGRQTISDSNAVISLKCRQ